MGCLTKGVSSHGGLSAQWVCLPREGVCLGEVSAQGGLPRGGVWLGGVSQHAMGQTPPLREKKHRQV